MVEDKILLIIEEVGPLTSIEIAEQTGWSRPFARTCVSRLKKAKKIHICEWRRDEEGGRLYPRAVYNVGHRKNAQKPKPLTKTEYRQRHREKKKGAITDIFSMAAPVDHRRLTTKKRPDVSERHRAARSD